MMLVLAMQFSRAGGPQYPERDARGAVCGERQSPPKWWALPQNGTEDESQWSTRESST